LSSLLKVMARHGKTRTGDLAFGTRVNRGTDPVAMIRTFGRTTYWVPESRMILEGMRNHLGRSIGNGCLFAS